MFISTNINTGRNDEYKEFIIECEEGLLELFAPNRDMVLDEKEQKRPHNIRSLKCAISDFFRIYKILIDKNNFEYQYLFKLFDWLFKINRLIEY